MWGAHTHNGSPTEILLVASRCLISWLTFNHWRADSLMIFLTLQRGKKKGSKNKAWTEKAKTPSKAPLPAKPVNPNELADNPDRPRGKPVPRSIKVASVHWSWMWQNMSVIWQPTSDLTTVPLDLWNVQPGLLWSQWMVSTLCFPETITGFAHNFNWKSIRYSILSILTPNRF